MPKPLKFLRRHYSTLKANLRSTSASGSKASMADILSLLAMTKKADDSSMPESLHFRSAPPFPLAMLTHICTSTKARLFSVSLLSQAARHAS